MPEPAKEKKKKRSLRKKVLLLCVLSLVFVMLVPMGASAASNVNVNVNGKGVDTLQIIEMFTILGLVPSILIMTTCFTRIIIVLSFLRNALGLQQTPPNQVLIAIALFLSLFIMSPVLNQINTDAYQPYKAQKITQEEFIQKASAPMKEFMLKQTKKDDLNLFINLSKTKNVKSVNDLSLTVIIPAFMTSELKRAFLIGFLIFIPFMIIDMIVSSTLMSMGMVMLPPSMISLPFKLLLFVLVDGWSLLFKTLVAGFNV
ncbi:MAG: flagellar type III secretion system pore protein FliP [Ruminococcaceae bacterium]|jgi:flagellar biosynthetic protein FliP|nr:flagellar type III secretion system pore protein FliP [Oscillospiraceae bacterium]HHV31933.1 flagellar type III secretion system pore protein FliP [Clostridiales bacterium]